MYKRIRTYIETQGFSYADVAKRAGFSLSCFMDLMQGTRTLYPDDLRAICLALHVQPEQFITSA